MRNPRVYRLHADRDVSWLSPHSFLEVERERERELDLGVQPSLRENCKRQWRWKQATILFFFLNLSEQTQSSR